MRRAFVGIGNRGLVARGVVFVIVGGFLLYAVYRYDPDQAGGLAEALRWLRDQDYGRALFFIVAAGLVFFGAYSLSRGRWAQGDAVNSNPWSVRKALISSVGRRRGRFPGG